MRKHKLVHTTYHVNAEGLRPFEVFLAILCGVMIAIIMANLFVLFFVSL